MVLKHLIHFLAEHKETIDFVILTFLVLIQWPVFFINILAEDRVLKDKLNISENINPDNMTLVMFGFLGGFALASRLIDKAVEVYGVKHSLSVFGLTFLGLAILFYLSTIYLFISLSIYAIILYIKAKRLKVKAKVITENKNTEV